MTCREKYVLDNAMKFAEGVTPPGCPDDYGYLEYATDENGYCICSCESCWNREIQNADEVNNSKLLEEKETEVKKLKTENAKLKAELKKANKMVEASCYLLGLSLD